MADLLPLPDRKYSVIYADPPWEYRQSGGKNGSRGMAKAHYSTMPTEDICKLPVREIAGGGAVLFLWATYPNIGEALKVMEAWGFRYVTAAFVWVKTYAKSGKPFWGMGAYTRANTEVCLLGVAPGFRAKTQIKSHAVHQIVQAPAGRHSEKPDEVRRRIVELLGDVPRIELFARQKVEGWDAWGDEI